MTFVAKVFDPKKMVQDYGDVKSEVKACRNGSVVFDFSFMSVARISGTQASDFFAQLTDRSLIGFEKGTMHLVDSDEQTNLLNSLESSGAWKSRITSGPSHRPRNYSLD